VKERCPRESRFDLQGRFPCGVWRHRESQDGVVGQVRVRTVFARNGLSSPAQGAYASTRRIHGRKRAEPRLGTERRSERRPVTPEVAGSSPVAPVSPFGLQIDHFVACSGDARRSRAATGSRSVLGSGRVRPSPSRRRARSVSELVVRARLVRLQTFRGPFSLGDPCTRLFQQ
jgi:hypothetical protein